MCQVGFKNIIIFFCFLVFFGTMANITLINSIVILYFCKLYIINPLFFIDIRNDLI